MIKNDRNRPRLFETMTLKLKSFTLALIQLGRIGSNKSENLNHARAMVMKAATGYHKKPDVIVLPVCYTHSLWNEMVKWLRNALTRPMDTRIFPYMQNILVLRLVNHTTW